MMLERFILFCLLLPSASPAFAQESEVPDTISIYKSQSGIGFSIYYKAWFVGSGGYRYTLNKLTRQDSIVMQDTNAYYFNVYDDKNRRLLSGGRQKNYAELTGDIIFYRKNGQLKKIEYWNNIVYTDTCGNPQQVYEDLGKEGTWKYYRKNGTLKKEVDRLITFNSCEYKDYTLKRRTRKYKSDGKLYSDKLKNKKW